MLKKRKLKKDKVVTRGLQLKESQVTSLQKISKETLIPISVLVRQAVNDVILQHERKR